MDSLPNFCFAQLFQLVTDVGFLFPQVSQGVQEVTSFIRIFSALLDTSLLRETADKAGEQKERKHLFTNPMSIDAR